jgi:hypothetical protein
VIDVLRARAERAHASVLSPSGETRAAGDIGATPYFFSALTRRRLKRGSFHSVVDLQAAIHRYIAEHNADPQPFIWTKTPAQILAKLNPPYAPVH